MPGGGGGGVPYIHEAGAPSGSQSLELVKNMIQVIIIISVVAIDRYETSVFIRATFTLIE